MRVLAVGLIGLVLLTFTGCLGKTAQEALLLSADDVAQAADLRESADTKVCLRVDGTVAASGFFTGSSVTGALDGVIVSGKSASFSDCVQYFDGPPTPSD